MTTSFFKCPHDAANPATQPGCPARTQWRPAFGTDLTGVALPAFSKVPTLPTGFLSRSASYVAPEETASECTPLARSATLTGSSLLTALEHRELGRTPGGEPALSCPMSQDEDCSTTDSGSLDEEETCSEDDPTEHPDQEDHSCCSQRVEQEHS